MISREYKSVMDGVQHPWLLQHAHGVEISRDHARKLVFDYLDEGEVIDVRFTSKRGFCKYRDNKVEISLLKDTVTLGNTLHEIAHALVWLDKGKVLPHGQEFINCLDDLLISEHLIGEEE